MWTIISRRPHHVDVLLDDDWRLLEPLLKVAVVLVRHIEKLQTPRTQVCYL